MEEILRIVRINLLTSRTGWAIMGAVVELHPKTSPLRPVAGWRAMERRSSMTWERMCIRIDSRPWTPKPN